MSQYNTLSFELRRNLRDISDVPENIPTLRAMFKSVAKCIPPVLAERFGVQGFEQGFDTTVKAVKAKSMDAKDAFHSLRGAFETFLNEATEQLSHLSEDDFKKRAGRGGAKTRSGKVTTFALYGFEGSTIEHAKHWLESGNLLGYLANGYGAELTDADRANIVKITNFLADSVKKSVPTDWRHKRQRKTANATTDASVKAPKGK